MFRRVQNLHATAVQWVDTLLLQAVWTHYLQCNVWAHSCSAMCGNTCTVQCVRDIAAVQCVDAQLQYNLYSMWLFISPMVRLSFSAERGGLCRCVVLDGCACIPFLQDVLLCMCSAGEGLKLFSVKSAKQGVSGCYTISGWGIVTSTQPSPITDTHTQLVTNSAGLSLTVLTLHFKLLGGRSCINHGIGCATACKYCLRHGCDSHLVS